MLGIAATKHWEAMKEEGRGSEGDLYRVRGYGIAFVVKDEATALRFIQQLENVTGDVEIVDAFAD